MYKTKTKEMALCGMLSAVVAIGTMAISIPVPATNGFINLGDGLIITIAFLMGGYYAVIAGATGSALADILLGYAQWAPFTLAIKGLVGLVAVKLLDRRKPAYSVKNISAVIAAETVMVSGYFLAGGILFSSFLVSLQEVPANIIQAAGAICVYLVLTQGILKATGKKSLFK